MNAPSRNRTYNLYATHLIDVAVCVARSLGKTPTLPPVVAPKTHRTPPDNGAKGATKVQRAPRETLSAKNRAPWRSVKPLATLGIQEVV